MKPVGSCHRCYRSVMQGERHDPADCRAALLETLERQKRDVRRTEANLREVGHTPAPTLASTILEVADSLTDTLDSPALIASRLRLAVEGAG